MTADGREGGALGPGIAGRNPCPKCHEKPQQLAGIVLFGDLSDEKEHRFLVCWDCAMIRKVKREEEWQEMPWLTQVRRGRVQNRMAQWPPGLKPQDRPFPGSERSAAHGSQRWQAQPQ